MTHFLLDAWDGDDDDHDDGDEDGDDGDDDGDDYFDNLFKYHMSSHIGSFTSDHGWKEKSLKLKVETNKSSIVRRTLLNIISQVYLSCCSVEELFHTEIRKAISPPFGQNSVGFQIFIYHPCSLSNSLSPAKGGIQMKLTWDKNA